MEQQINRIYNKSNSNGITLNLYKKYCLKMKIGKTSKNCSICFIKFEQGDIINQLPCKHIFHSKCIKPWLNLSPCCPNCRLDLKKYDLEQKKNMKKQECCQIQPINEEQININQHQIQISIQENQISQ
ncbi:C3HC4 type (RING finger) zinc finger protein (macronuclear) [Tetrahymena thermophila SB210]|uniref:C3HC4 type (RING finger) zinc finger protein n=1 Tax=Tetrahymena thermophila (strain SB210) TaxID=312017 RepID=W7XA72_TETTS|nr:C3HC4 type (RING finger) zinc finger protein [Tetrahymena thermophila SB210]EWS74242.1 C3HC4 type (RING finger) zinc finger protein [Tetrahymena thermophila SB210]|eukprot:XP_012653215.1 C3HC4 type (RING finger) zinc finger protein [Tetrahymena thermophila SB210]